MPPFSNKKKKQQLQLKRQLKRERDDDPNSFYKIIMQKTHHRGKPIGNQNNPKIGGGRNQDDSSSRNRERFADLQFFKDTDEEIKERKEQALMPISPLEDVHLEVDASSPLSQLDMPKRPSWNKSFSREQLDRQEQAYFKNYVNNLLEGSVVSDKKLSYFDLNLDTWRQLWRVLEMSEIITIIVDIRQPLFHFPPALYRYIVDELKKMVIIVLNKIDLVPAPLVIAWQSYLKSQYPEVRIVPFASYAGMKTKSNGKRVGNMKMAADGAKRFMLEVEKLVGSGNIDFTSWKEKIRADSNTRKTDRLPDSESDLEREDGEETNEARDSDDVVSSDCEEDREFGAKALSSAQQIKAKNDTTYYEGERYKDGILTIGCVGHPNVGKSSFMNALIGRKVVSVSRTPGHTKHFQTIFLTPNIRLCDCPGLVFPSYHPKQLQVLMGCYPISQLREPYSSIQYLSERVDVVSKLNLKPAEEIRHEKPAVNDANYTPAETVRSDQAGTSSQWSAWTICESWALHRGFLTARSGRPDVYRAANHLLRMALDGRTLCLSFYPPDYLSQRDSHWKLHEDISKIERIQGKQNIVNDEDDGY